ncbi:MAG: Phosphate propanoyltransferase [Firmicutes bacterium]|nr:Phosphate propanoyltransferase [Bacillota bacterium]MBT9157095.1 Phosphate propanoyltransferase [Bacillota bacterium]
MKIPVGISGRHLHLSAEDLALLFGGNRALQKSKELSQHGQYAAMERVTLVGPKGEIANTRVLGPTRPRTQIEVSMTDAVKLGIMPPVRESGDMTGASNIRIRGPMGEIEILEAVIIAWRHIHMSPQEAVDLGLCDKDRVSVCVPGQRGGSLNQVVVRVRPDFRLELHIDTDEANAFGLQNGDLVEIC